ncbi:AMP-binding protein [Georgenia sp. Z1491]|uniref:AMP-binding protein n=1 Tax=Georgenia sp. Z1491 TaxID=3416707 RepID=UPI003CF02022
MIDKHPDGHAATAGYRPLWHQLRERRGSDAAALVLDDPGLRRRVTWRELADDVEMLALGLKDAGVRPGQRVGVSIPPGVELTLSLFAVLRLGGVAVLADPRLGARGLDRALRGAELDHLLGTPVAARAARVRGWTANRYLVRTPFDRVITANERRLLGLRGVFLEILDHGRELVAGGVALPEEPDPDDDALVVFQAAGSLRPNGVVYTHRTLAAMCEATTQVVPLDHDHGLVAGFAPAALLALAVGAPAVIPGTGRPGTLTGSQLARAARRVPSPALAVSPAGLASVVATAGRLAPDERDALTRLRRVVVGGAPVTAGELARAARLLGEPEMHAPYGMAGLLPLTDLTLPELRAATASSADGAGGGTCVGRPVPGARVGIVPLDHLGAPVGDAVSTPGVTGEVVGTAPHLRDRYLLPAAEQARAQTLVGWHRTGDLGHLDAEGRLWLEGRVGHEITTENGVVTPIALEIALRAIPGVTAACVVGVGPRGAQDVVAVLETDPRRHRGARAKASRAPRGLTAAARAAVAGAVAAEAAVAGSGPVPVRLDAVLRMPRIPVDVRYGAQVQRAAVAHRARVVLGRTTLGE